MAPEPKTTIHEVVNANKIADIQRLAAAIWTSVNQHPMGASCECPAVAAMRVLEDIKREKESSG